MTAELTSPLISASELRNQLALPKHQQPRVFDVRGKWGGNSEEAQQDYQQGHIEGSVFLDWTMHFLTPNIDIHLAPVAPKDEAQVSFESLGIDKNDAVVLYDDYHHMLAGRIWWAMRYWGFSNVTVLNGGWKYWQACKYPISTKNNPLVQNNKTKIFTVNKQVGLRTPLDAIIYRSSNVCLVDARGERNYLGNRNDPLSGHIPGALNIPFRSLLNANNGCFQNKATLEHLLESLIPRIKETPIIASCGSGYAGTVFLLALQEIGITAPLFDDSFSVWKQDSNRPIEQGHASNTS